MESGRCGGRCGGVVAKHALGWLCGRRELEECRGQGWGGGIYGLEVRDDEGAESKFLNENTVELCVSGWGGVRNKHLVWRNGTIE